MLADASGAFWAALLILILLVASVWRYALYAREIKARGGRVASRFFGVPDLFFGAALCFYFALNGAVMMAGRQTGSVIEKGHVIENSFFMLAVLVVLLVFPKVRGIPLVESFEISIREIAPSIFRAVIALLSALPLIFFVNLASRFLLPERYTEQSMVSLFRSASETGDWSVVIWVVFSAVLVAPLVEEFLFRGYFYPVLKRFIGPLWAGIWISVLFSLSHGTVAVFGGIFTLSVCLLMAFERFGSLWVCIGMHALFNGVSLFLIYLQGRGLLPS